MKYVQVPSRAWQEDLQLVPITRRHGPAANASRRRLLGERARRVCHASVGRQTERAGVSRLLPPAWERRDPADRRVNECMQ